MNKATKWNEYKFLSLNELSDYQGQINFLAGKKDIWSYSGDIMLNCPTNLIGQSNIKYKIYFTDDIVIMVNNSNGNLKFNPEGHNVDTYYKIQVISDNDIKAIYNCSQISDDVGTLQAFDISGNDNHSTFLHVNRQVVGVNRTWQPIINRAKQTLRYQLQSFYHHRGFGIDDIVDKIDNKDYFKTSIAYLTLSYIYQDLALSNSYETIYSNKSADYKRKYKQFFNIIISLIKFDLNEDGNVDFKPKVSVGTLII